MFAVGAAAEGTDAPAVDAPAADAPAADAPAADAPAAAAGGVKRIERVATDEAGVTSVDTMGSTITSDSGTTKPVGVVLAGTAIAESTGIAGRVETPATAELANSGAAADSLTNAPAPLLTPTGITPAEASMCGWRSTRHQFWTLITFGRFYTHFMLRNGFSPLILLYGLRKLLFAMFPLLLGLLALPLQRPLSPRSVGPRLSASSMAPPVSENALVIGAGPAGIASAIMLAQRGYQVEVLDRLEAPAAVDSATWSDTARFYLIGLGGRGQLALQKIGAWASVDKYCSTVVGRKDWSPGAAVDAGVERVFSDRPYLTKVIQRDRLVSCLLQHAKEAYGDSITVRHSVDVNALHWETGESGERAVITCVPCGEEGCGEEGVSSTAQTTPFQFSAPLLVGADGVSRTVGEAVAAADADRFFPWRRFRIRRYEDTSVRVYKTVPFELPEDSPKQGESSTGWRGDINYSARTKTINFDALPSPSGGYCGVLLIKPEDAITQSIPDVPAAREYFDELLPQ